MPRVVASIEARMSSTRLPGKVLADINGAPALSHLTRRLRRSKRLDDLVLATTTAPADDALAEWALGEGVPCHRGSEDDVLGRVVEAHRKMDTEIVVEVCGDTPLADPEVIDLAVDTFDANQCDVVSNTRWHSFPQGIDAQVFALSDLEEVARKVSDPAVREHVSLYFYEHPDSYRILNLIAPPAWRAPELRLQMDYPEDLKLIREIHARLEPDFGDAFGVGEILALLARQPELARINMHCEEKLVR